MTRKLIWTGIILGLIPLYMGAACGGYIGWPGLSTSGADAKVTEELSVSGSANPLENGLWTYYVQYNNIGQQAMQSVSTYRDGTAPPGVFTSDGLLEQHFSDHVGVEVASAIDSNGDGVICWIGCSFEAGDYTIANAFCPAVGGTGSTSKKNGFQAYCNKGVWELIVAQGQFEETRGPSPASKYSHSGVNFGNIVSPAVLGQILATSQYNSGTGALTATVNGLSLPGGASHTLTTPISFNLFGFYHGVAINVSQAGLVEAANWLASQWAGQPDGTMNVTVSLNGGAASASMSIASGNSASIVMQNFAATH